MTNDFLFKQLKRAYKKLKASIYFDKTQLVFRNKIVVYEGINNLDVDEQLKQIVKLLTGRNNKWIEYENSLLSSIKALTYTRFAGHRRVRVK